ncbi:hypothetical protein ACH4MW_12120 [Streptomyces luteogriseus]
MACGTTSGSGMTRSRPFVSGGHKAGAAALRLLHDAQLPLEEVDVPHL